MPIFSFPGCQLAASRGEQVLRVYEHLRKGLNGGVALGLRCCGVPARWAGREDLFEQSVQEIREQWEALGRPRVITACSSCLKTLKDSQPDMTLISLWEVLEKECPEPESRLPETLSIQDPCSARHDSAWLSSVRSLLARHGVTVEEPGLSREKTACCGYGGLTWSAQPEVASAMASHRASQLPHDAVASCIMCRDRLVAEGKKCRHMFDVLFPCEDVKPFDPAEPGRACPHAGPTGRNSNGWLCAKSPAQTFPNRKKAGLMCKFLLNCWKNWKGVIS